MSPMNRREFLKTTVAAGALAGAGALPLHAARRTGTDMVTLGNSGMKVTRLAFGTGSNNGHVQAALGQKEFSRLIAYAYDRGIRFFETAESYMTPRMLGEALKPFPRDSYQLMHKVTTDRHADPQKRFDDLRRVSQTEYFDIMLLHYQHTGNWMEETKHWQEAMLQAQSKNIIKTRGASVRTAPTPISRPDEIAEFPESMQSMNVCARFSAYLNASCSDKNSSGSGKLATFCTG